MSVNDVADFHILRTQPDVMINTSTGKVDPDHEATRAWIDRFLKPNDSTTFEFAIEELRNPGVAIGCVGCHIAEPPTLGYMFRQEFWGRGYATEAVQGWLKAYWELPRYEIDLQSDMPESCELQWEGDIVREALVATVEAGNASSVKVMGKCGFKPTGVEEKVEDFRGPAVLVHYYLEPPAV